MSKTFSSPTVIMYNEYLRFLLDFKEYLLNNSEDIVDFMDQLGYWCQERSPWLYGVDDNYWCGFTPHGVTGWNGTPDSWVGRATKAEARWDSAFCRLVDARDALDSVI